jgi:hypothetical protein
MTITDITKDANELLVLIEWTDIIQNWQSIADTSLTIEKTLEANRMVDKYIKVYEQNLAKFLLTKTELL